MWHLVLVFVCERECVSVCVNTCLPETTCELMVVMETLPCCRPPAGTTIPDGLTELETEVMDGEEV